MCSPELPASARGAQGRSCVATRPALSLWNFINSTGHPWAHLLGIRRAGGHHQLHGAALGQVLHLLADCPACSQEAYRPRGGNNAAQAALSQVLESNGVGGRPGLEGSGTRMVTDSRRGRTPRPPAPAAWVGCSRAGRLRSSGEPEKQRAAVAWSMVATSGEARRDFPLPWCVSHTVCCAHNCGALTWRRAAAGRPLPATPRPSPKPKSTQSRCCNLLAGGLLASKCNGVAGFHPPCRSSGVLPLLESAAGWLVAGCHQCRLLSAPVHLFVKLRTIAMSILWPSLLKYTAHQHISTQVEVT